MTVEKLQAENAELRRRLEEAEETIHAIQSGTVDAFVVEEAGTHRIYTLEAADRPYRLFVEQMQQGAATIHADGTIVYCNRQLADLLKIPPEKLIGTLLVDFIAHDDRAIYENLLWQGQTRSGRGQARLRRMDGGLVPAYLTFSALPKDCGAVTGVLITDLTAQKHHEQLTAANESLRKSEAWFRKMADTAPVLLWVTDQDGSCTFLSYGWYEYTGQAEEDGLGVGWLSMIHADDREAASRIFLEAIKQHEAFEIDYRLRCSDGDYRWCIDKGRPRFSETGEFQGYIGSVIDVHERKQAEQALHESEERLQVAVGAAKLGQWILDLQTREMTCSDGCKANFGKRPGDRFTYDDLWTMVHPDDRDRVQAAVQHAVETHTDYDTEYRLFWPDGSLHWVIVRGRARYAEDGTALDMAGVTLDITDRRLAEERLRESEERYRSLVLVIADVPWTADADGAFTTPQDAYSRYTGKSWDELRGFGWTNCIHPEDREGLVSIWKDAVATRSTYNARCREWHGPTQQWRHVVARGTPVLNPDGSVREWVGTLTDVHERTLAETSLRSFAEELERRVSERTSELVQSQERLRALATELNLTEQRERKRIATELHDHLQQLLVLGKLTIGQGKRVATGVPACESVLQKVDDIFSEALTYSRTLVTELSPPVLREHGFVAGLKWLGEYMMKHEQTVMLVVPDEEVQLTEDQKMLLFQSVRELLINSSKHAGTGRATVNMTVRDGYLEISVSDEGLGFDPTAVAATGVHSDEISSKFGLFSIQERMRALGGMFDIRSGKSQGTTATLTMPFAKSAEFKTSGPERSETEGSRLSPEHASRSSTKVRVLLVDDHIIVRQGIRAMLNGYADIELIGEAGHGEEAVSLVDQLRPEVVVMDINMPKMSGIEATAAIKRRHPKIPILGLSVNTGDDNEEAMLKAGASRLLNKESAVEQLYEAIHEAVSKG